MTYRNEIEIQVNNVTLAQFLSYVRNRCKKKNIPVEIMSAKEFANVEVASMGSLTKGHDDWKSDYWRTRPYNYQTCSIKKDGSSGFNEICEFEFDDDKTGHGYYYYIDWNKETEIS